jgi:hypothetical protein
VTLEDGRPRRIGVDHHHGPLLAAPHEHGVERRVARCVEVAVVHVTIFVQTSILGPAAETGSVGPGGDAWLGR